MPHPPLVLAGRGLYFEDVEVGTGWDTARLRIEEEEVIRFAREWDPHPFHVDRKAAEASVFGSLCASGIHTTSRSIK